MGRGTDNASASIGVIARSASRGSELAAQAERLIAGFDELQQRAPALAQALLQTPISTRLPGQFSDGPTWEFALGNLRRASAASWNGVAKPENNLAEAVLGGLMNSMEPRLQELLAQNP